MRGRAQGGPHERGMDVAAIIHWAWNGDPAPVASAAGAQAAKPQGGQKAVARLCAGLLLLQAFRRVLPLRLMQSRLGRLDKPQACRGAGGGQGRHAGVAIRFCLRAGWLYGVKTGSEKGVFAGPCSGAAIFLKRLRAGRARG